MTPSSPQQIALPQAPTAPPPPPIFGSSPIGQKPPQKSAQATFLGSASLPSQSNQGFKTLLGT